MTSRAPLSPAESARRAELAQAAAQHPERTGCADDCAHPAHRPTPLPVDTEQPRVSDPDKARAFVEEAQIDTWQPDAHGLARWAVRTDRVGALPLPGGAKLLVVGGIRIKLPREAAAHLGRLLIGEQAP